MISCLGDIAILDGTASAAPLCAARDGRPFLGRPVDRITFARWGTEHPEDVVVCRVSESEFEVHCHGGRAAVARIRDELTSSGRFAEPTLRHEPPAGEWPRVWQRMLDVAWRSVTYATTLRTADLLVTLANEAWPSLLQKYPSRFSGNFAELVSDCLRWSEFGRHLIEPWKVAIAGKPNAGKSSLMNA
ncbi:MAG TPA: hypothetical protein VM452_20430, partial [Caulifigura sp.]|nr:hypothetical protein [Caulifigura sp.]